MLVISSDGSNSDDRDGEGVQYTAVLATTSSMREVWSCPGLATSCKS